MLRLLKACKLHKLANGTRKDVAILTMGTASAQLVIIAATPILSRLYTPSQFGVVAVFIATASIMATFVTLRYEVNILAPKEDEEAKLLVKLSMVLGICLSFIAFLLALLLPEAIQESLGLGILKLWFPWTCLIGLAIAISAISYNWLNRNRQYKKIAIMRIIQAGSFTVLAIFLGLLNLNDGLLIAQTVSVSIIAVFIFLSLSIPEKYNLHDLATTAYKHIKTPQYILPAALLDTIALQMPPVVIGTLFDADLAGQFSMAWRMLMLPMSLLGSAIGQVFSQKFSQVIQKENDAKTLLLKTWVFLGGAGAIPMILLLFFGEPIFTSILGESWKVAGIIATIISPMALAMFISSPTSYAFISLGLQKNTLLFGVITFLYRPMCIYLGFTVGSLLFGLGLWVLSDILVIVFYQYIAWNRLAVLGRNRLIIEEVV